MSTTASKPDPRDPDPRDAQDADPLAGMSDDPRGDPTPDLRQSDTDTDADAGTGV
ncbi:MAG: hypothetical protein IAI49_10615 [Candidatus Eremiobacteraeota bacterium]|nr:hypothetical protein [Candidatus Eremiobacteraeota bacterium]